MTEAEFCRELFLLDAATDGNVLDSLFTRIEDGKLIVSVNANDLFSWATADCVDLTPDNLPVLRQAIDDCRLACPGFGEIYATMLFACRVEKTRPIRPRFPKDRPELHPLFDAAGPEKP